MSNPNAPASPLPAFGGWRWLAIAALLGYGVFLGWNFSSVAGGADSSGYLNSARLLAAGELAAELRTPPEFGPQAELRRQQFQPHGFVPFDGNPRLSPTYAVGLPLHLALAGTLFGWELAPRVVGIVAALAALALCHAVGRRVGLSPPLALCSAALLAAYPVFIFTSLQPLSDTLATTWCLAAVYGALRATESPRWALLCGFAFAVAVLVRATNALLLPALVVFIGANVRALGLAVLGGLPGAVWLGYYNRALYGSPFRSGYVDIAQAFGWEYGWPTLLHFAQWLALMLPAALLLLPIVAIRRGTLRGRLLAGLALWFLAFTGLYAFYAISHEVWWDLRFILPGTPALLFAGLLGVEALGRTPGAAPRMSALGAVVLTTWAVLLGIGWTRKYHLLLMKTYEQTYADAAAAARDTFPPNALVIAGLHSGALYYYTPFAVMRWEFVNAAEFAGFRAQAESVGRPIGAVLFDVEEREALQEKCPGEWTKVGAVRNVSLWRLGPAPITARE